MLNEYLIAVLFAAAPQGLPMKSLFVIGDSISIHYGPYLEQALEGSFSYDRKRDDAGLSNQRVPAGENGGDSAMVLEYLKAKSRDSSFRPDLLLLNCGLHDIKRDHEEGGKLQVPPVQYRRNLEEIFSISVALGTQLIWVRTTAVVDAIHNKLGLQFHRYERDLDEYNRIADDVFRERGVPTVDLYTFTRKQGSEVFIDHVHYNQKTRALQAAFIAGFMQQFKAD
jgi:hypothetical protein